MSEMNIGMMEKELIEAEIEDCRWMYRKPTKLNLEDAHDILLVFVKYEDRMYMENEEVYQHFCKMLKKLDMNKVNEAIMDEFYN